MPIDIETKVEGISGTNKICLLQPFRVLSIIDNLPDRTIPDSGNRPQKAPYRKKRFLSKIWRGLTNFFKSL